jgi:DNA-binding transcriptional LysR family regulator
VTDHLIRYLPTFVLVADELGFSPAARRLGMSPAGVSKAIRVLEEGLGTRLFQRSTHGLVLTDEGLRLRRHVGPLLNSMSEALAQATSDPRTPRGILRVSAPYGIGKNELLPILPEFRRLYPEVELDLRFEDRSVDLIKERIDVAMGVRLEPSPGLISKRVSGTRLLLVASPQFLEANGAPEHPEDVLRFPCIRYRMASTQKLFPWRFHDPVGGGSFVVDPPPVISASSQEVSAELAAAHQGLALIGLVSGHTYLRAGSLVEVLRDSSYQLPPMMLFYTSKRNLPSRVRVFIDFVSDNLADLM